MDGIRNEFCNLCSNSVGCKNVCIMGRGNLKAKLMIVAESPSNFDDENNSVLASKKDELLKNIISKVLGLDVNEFYFTYLVKCKTIDGKPPTESDATACFHYLKREIKEVKPVAILALGALATKMLTGQNSITKVRGQVFTTPSGIKVIPTFSPGYVEQVQQQLKNFATDIQKAYHVSIDQLPAVSSTKIVMVDTFDKVREIVSYIEQTGDSCFDFETTGLEILTKEDEIPTCLSLSFQHGSSYVIPLFHFESPFTAEEVLEIIAYINAKVFANKNIRKIAHNLKFDMHVARKYGCTFRGRLDDTMLMHHLLNELEKHGLKEISDTYFKEFSGYEDEVKKYKWAEVPLKLLAPYAGTDTDLTFRLCTLFESYLLKDERVYVLYRNLVMSVLPTLQEAEQEGMPIDRDFLQNSIAEVDKLIESQTIKLRAHKKVQEFENWKRDKVNWAAIEELENKLFLLRQQRDSKREETLKKLLDATEIRLNDAIMKRLAKGEKGKVTATEITLEEKLRGLKAGTVDPLASSANITQIQMEERLRGLKAGTLSIYQPLNFKSPDQVEELLYFPEGFGFKKQFSYKTKTEGGTGKDVLNEIKDKSGFIDDLLLMRSIEKMQGTYLKGILKRLDKNNKIHTEFKQHGTMTGRLSSANPNLQNLPNVGKLKNDTSKYVVSLVKKCFIPEPGMSLIQVDFSQAELRIIASFAKEETMLDAYAQNLDLHTVTGANVNGYTLEQFAALEESIRKDLRTKAKPGNFGMIYGISPEGFQEYAKQNYGVIFSLKEAQDIRDKFFKLYPGLLRYHSEYIAKAQKFGYVRTLFGRKRLTPNIHSVIGAQRADDERVAINSPVQGTSGELTLFAAALLRHRLNPVVKLRNTVHDSLIYFAPHHLVADTIRIIKETCENLPTELYFGRVLEGVQMKVDIEISTKSWKELEPFEQAA